MKGNLKWLLGGVTLIFFSQVNASGYKLEFMSTSVLADAGDAAVVEDAGTNWYNSAGLVYLPPQFVASSIYGYEVSTFAGDVHAPSPFGAAYDYNASGRASSHVNAYLPALHYAIPLSERLAVGLSAVPAWGLSEDYGQASILRYDLTRIFTRTIDLAPSIAFKLSSHWSIGIGPDFHYMSLESKSYARTEGPPALGGTTTDSTSRFSANSWDYGAHFGILYRVNDALRFGLNYRTKIVQRLQGYSHFILGARGPNFETNAFTLTINLPPTTSFSGYYAVTPVFAVMGTIAYDQWGVLRNYHATNYMQPGGPIPNVYLPQYMHNTLDYGLGCHIRLSEKTLLRFSFKYEPTPTQTEYRDVDFPDSPKFGINMGSRYRMCKDFAFDLLYAHVFNRRVGIHGLNPISKALASGKSKTTMNFFGAQIVWNISI